jgi:hypothetical protein
MRKILTFISASLLATLATAATLSPVSLLNPAGSTAGQAIVSTGPSTPPAWGAVPPASLGPVAANTVIANATGSTAAPTAFAVPSCSGANNALLWTSGTGLTCGTGRALTTGNLSQFAATTSAQLLGVLSDETGSGLAVFGTSPSLTTPTIAGAALSGTFSGTPTFSGATAFTSTITPSTTAGIVGTKTNDNANAGSFGEYVTATGTNVSLTNNVAANVTSISLTAGDWDVSAGCRFNPGVTTTLTQVTCAVGSTSATLPAAGEMWWNFQGSMTTGGTQSGAVPTQRFSLSSTTTVYLIGLSGFGVSTMTVTGTIRARRIR